MPETQELQKPKPKIRFLFLNRIGFRNDSINKGSTYTLFRGPCIDTKFYSKEMNVTHLNYACYNRNFAQNSLPTADSIAFSEFEYGNGSKFAMQVQMRWWKYNYGDPVPVNASKIITYTTKGWPKGDTIKIAKDTIIKFIWPDDTASGRFIKTYQWP